MRLGGSRGTARQAASAPGHLHAEQQRQTRCRRCRIQLDRNSRKRRQSAAIVMASGARLGYWIPQPGSTILTSHPTQCPVFQERCSRQRLRPRTKPTRNDGRRAAAAPAARTNGALHLTPALHAWCVPVAGTSGTAPLHRSTAVATHSLSRLHIHKQPRVLKAEVSGVAAHGDGFRHELSWVGLASGASMHGLIRARRRWTLNWDDITPEIVVGSCPRSPEDVVRESRRSIQLLLVGGQLIRLLSEIKWNDQTALSSETLLLQCQHLDRINRKCSPLLTNTGATSCHFIDQSADKNSHAAWARRTGWSRRRAPRPSFVCRAACATRLSRSTGPPSASAPWSAASLSPASPCVISTTMIRCGAQGIQRHLTAFQRA